MAERVAFVGLGTMGLPMARNLVAAGYDVVGCDADPERVPLLGARAASTPAEAARDADVVIVSLPSPAIVEEVAFGRDGVAEGISEGATFVDMSTNAPAAARSLAERFAEAGVGVLDAPVSGGPRGAEERSLAIMVGGPRELFDRWLPLFEALGSHVVHVGGAGAGQTAKLCNNLVAGVTMAAVSEACAIAVRAGVDARTLYDLLRSSTGDSRVLRTRFPLPGADPAHPVNDGYAPLFMLDLLLKDLRLGVELASDVAVDVPLARSAIERYAAARAAGHGSLDYSAVHLVAGEAAASAATV